MVIDKKAIKEAIEDAFAEMEEKTILYNAKKAKTVLGLFPDLKELIFDKIEQRSLYS
jgi:hypothetical protein